LNAQLDQNNSEALQGPYWGQWKSLSEVLIDLLLLISLGD
jgi:hypothetical protein